MENRKEAADARTARDATLGEAEAAAILGGEAEANLKVLQDDHAACTRLLQQREEEVKPREARLAAHDSELAEVSAGKATERGRLEVL